MDRGQKISGGLVVARCDATELLQPVERAFDAIAILVSFEVAGDWLLAVRLGRDDRQDSAHQKRRANIVTIVLSLVREHHFGRSNGQVEKRRNCFVIGDFSTGQDKAKRASLTVCTGVDFRRKAAAASTKTFLMSPPLAPAACEWPRIVVVSIIGFPAVHPKLPVRPNAGSERKRNSICRNVRVCRAMGNRRA